MNEEHRPVHNNFIGGKSIPAVSGRTFQRFTPYDQTLVATYQDSDERDVELAVDASREAFDNGPWPRLSAVERAAILHRAADLLRERVDSLSVVLASEVGQPGQRAAVLEAADHIDYNAALAVSRRDDAIYGQRHDAIGIVAKEPIGVVGSLTSWNVPLSVAYKTLPGIAVGCTAVVKPGHQASGAVVEFAKILQEANLPDGVFNYVTSARENGAIAGQAIAAHSRVDMVTFTGSHTTGRAVMRAASDSLKKVSLELGGKSPHVVFADAESLDAIAASAAKGIVRLAGQSCQAGSRLLLQESVKDEFMELLLAHVAKAKLGSPFDQSTTCGPLVTDEQRQRVEKHVAAGLQEAALVVGGKRPGDPELRKGFFFEPTVFDNVPPNARIAQEEVFGPVLSVMTFKDLDDAVSLANQTVFGLAAGCWTRDIDTALQFGKRIRSGVMWINSYRDDSVLKHMPMGGYKQSGVGRERGPEGMDAFLEPKSIMIKLR